MHSIIFNGQPSVKRRAKLKSTATAQGLTGLTSASSGLIISTIADNESTATAYSVAASKVETISTLGTYAAPTATKCRFKEVDATNHPGIYEFQFADARFAVSGASELIVSVSGAANLADCDFRIQLDSRYTYGLIEDGTAQAYGADTLTVKATSRLKNGVTYIVVITSATTGDTQAAYVTSIDETTPTAKVLTVSPNWPVTLTGTVLYEIFAAPPLTATGSIAAIKVVTDKMSTMIQQRGSNSDYQLTTHGVELAPTGGGASAQQIIDAIDAGDSVVINNINSKVTPLPAVPVGINDTINANITQLVGEPLIGNGTTVPLHP